MAFSERLKLRIKRRSHFRCCLCRSLEVEIHHILPQEEGGADTEDNAAPLCPSCHETYGGNPKKRKFIREARDFWFETCDLQTTGNSVSTQELRGLIENAASKDDLKSLQAEVRGLVQAFSTASGKTLTAKSKTPPSNEVPIERYIQHLYEVDYGNKFDGYSILFDSRLWYESGDDEYELLDMRREFLHRFGEETARRLCLKVQSDLKLDLSTFTEEELGHAIHGVHIEVLLILWHKKFSKRKDYLVCVINEDGEFAWLFSPKICNTRKSKPNQDVCS